MPNGVARNFTGINYWTPVGEGANFELSPILTPLAPYRDRLTVVSGLAQHQADAFDDGANGDHTRGTSSWLTGVHPQAHRRRRRAERDLGGSDRGGGDRQGHRAALARAGDRSELPRRAMREQLQLRLPQHAVVAFADDADADREQSARSSSSGCSATAARRRSGWRRRARTRSILDSVIDDLDRLQSDAGCRPIARRWATTSIRCGKSSGAFSASKRAVARPSCRRWNVRRAFPSGSTSTSS